MSWQSEIHVGEQDKPNEDACLANPALGLAVVADGVTRSRDGEGKYPSGSTLAPRLLVEQMEKVVLDAPGGANREALSLGLALANSAIGQANAESGISEGLDFQSRDYLGTTGVALLVKQEGQRTSAHFAFIGDPMLFHIRPTGEVALLTRDQLRNCHQFGKPTFDRLARLKGWSQREAARRRLLWQRRDVRNNAKARDTQGNLIGFGVLTGEAKALDFIETGSVEVGPGDRFVLASDALRACSAGHGAEKAEDYLSLSSLFYGTTTGACARLLVGAVRQAEQEKGLRSDDATVVVVDVQCSTTEGE